MVTTGSGKAMSNQAGLANRQSGLGNTKARLYLAESPPGVLSNRALITLPTGQSHYVARVLRSKPGDLFALFNARDGEWLAKAVTVSKTATELEPVRQLRQPVAVPALTLAFAPLRKERLAFMLEKATELGVTRFQPFISDFTNWKFNREKARKTVLEAVEQCERLDLPAIEPLATLPELLKKPCLVALERGSSPAPLSSLSGFPAEPVLLIGPEGGFSPREQQRILSLQQASVPESVPKSVPESVPASIPESGQASAIPPANCHAVSLGSRILRAETAAVTGLVLIQSRRGVI